MTINITGKLVWSTATFKENTLWEASVIQLTFIYWAKSNVLCPKEKKWRGQNLIN